jgi:hypothetical protein
MLNALITHPRHFCSHNYKRRQYSLDGTSHVGECSISVGTD